MHDKTKNGRGVPFGAARRLLLLRLLSPSATWLATSRDTCSRARFESRYSVYVTYGTFYVRPLHPPPRYNVPWSYYRGKEGRRNKAYNHLGGGSSIILTSTPIGACTHIYKMFVQNNNTQKKLYKKKLIPFARQPSRSSPPRASHGKARSALAGMQPRWGTSAAPSRWATGRRSSVGHVLLPVASGAASGVVPERGPGLRPRAPRRGGPPLISLWRPGVRPPRPGDGLGPLPRPSRMRRCAWPPGLSLA